MWIRPITPVVLVGLDTVSLWKIVCAYLIVFGIFLLVARIVCKRVVKEKKPIGHALFYLSIIVGLIVLLVFGVTIEALKGMILALLLLYASFSDLETRKVSDCISIMIFILSFVCFDAANFPSMLIGAVIVFVPQFALAIIQPNRACGGADLKISTAIAFMLGAGKGIFALIVGMLLAVIVMAIYNRVKAKDSKAAFPLVPFLSFGAMLAYLI